MTLDYPPRKYKHHDLFWDAVMWAPLRDVFEPFYNKMCNEALEQANELRYPRGWGKLHPKSMEFPITVLAWGEGWIEELPSFKLMTSESTVRCGSE